MRLTLPKSHSLCLLTFIFRTSNSAVSKAGGVCSMASKYNAISILPPHAYPLSIAKLSRVSPSPTARSIKRILLGTHVRTILFPLFSLTNRNILYSVTLLFFLAHASLTDDRPWYASDIVVYDVRAPLTLLSSFPRLLSSYGRFSFPPFDVCLHLYITSISVISISSPSCSPSAPARSGHDGACLCVTDCVVCNHVHSSFRSLSVVLLTFYRFRKISLIPADLFVTVI